LAKAEVKLDHCWPMLQQEATSLQTLLLMHEPSAISLAPVSV
jgi:hypothetical protein